MTFAPRFSPDGGTVVFSLEQGGNTDIYAAVIVGSGIAGVYAALKISQKSELNDGILLVANRNLAKVTHVMPKAVLLPS